MFQAWTTPDLVRRWWGLESSTLVVCDIDLRPGGGWRYVTREPDGTELGWHGTYLEIDVRAGWCRRRSSRATPTARPGTRYA